MNKYEVLIKIEKLREEQSKVWSTCILNVGNPAFENLKIRYNKLTEEIERMQNLVEHGVHDEACVLIPEKNDEELDACLDVLERQAGICEEKIDEQKVQISELNKKLQYLSADHDRFEELHKERKERIDMLELLVLALRKLMDQFTLLNSLGERA